MYFVDVYTSQSVLYFEFETLDSALAVVDSFIVPAQVISIYSYRDNPYKIHHIYEEPDKLDKDQLENTPDSSLYPLLLSMAGTKGIRQVCDREDAVRQRGRCRRRRKKSNHKK